jgi:L-ascorbate metabolism protein UlaG (beta-lactamase superfamily)
MRVSYFGYNAFVIETGTRQIAIDPGGSLYLLRRWLKSLIPDQLWPQLTHILVTHGDPDHYWHADRLAEASHAAFICNRSMVKEVKGEHLLLGPRDRGLAFTTRIKNLYPLSPGEIIECDGLEVTGLPAEHGPLPIRLGPFVKSLTPGPKERIGWGAMGYRIQMDDWSAVNLGDTLLLEEQWKGIAPVDLLMLPVGGSSIHNTMDEKEALRAVELFRPAYVIPCHYNCPGLFNKRANPANVDFFRDEVIKRGAECIILESGESVEL